MSQWRNDKESIYISLRSWIDSPRFLSLEWQHCFAYYPAPLAFSSVNDLENIGYRCSTHTQAQSVFWLLVSSRWPWSVMFTGINGKAFWAEFCTIHSLFNVLSARWFGVIHDSILCYCSRRHCPLWYKLILLDRIWCTAYGHYRIHHHIVAIRCIARYRATEEYIVYGCYVLWQSHVFVWLTLPLDQGCQSQMDGGPNKKFSYNPGAGLIEC